MNINSNKLNSQNKYESLSVLTLINKKEKLEDNKIIYFKGFNNLINELNLILLINNLKNNDKYIIEILNSSFDSSLIEKLSNLGNNNDFDFINLKINNCLNLEEITKNEIISERGYEYSIIKII